MKIMNKYDRDFIQGVVAFMVATFTFAFVAGLGLVWVSTL